MVSTIKTDLESGRKFRLITRSDMDGLVCAIILKELDLIDDIVFAHPKDMQDGSIDVSDRDITTNLPYVPGVYLCFDHHASEVERIEGNTENRIINPDAPSAARVLYDYFHEYSPAKLQNISQEMMIAVDKADSADFTKEEILNPEGWVLLSFIMDARTGLGRFRDFNISNFELMMKLIDYCREHQSIEKILSLPDVKERVDLYNQHKSLYQEQIQRCTAVYNNLVVLDLRREENIWSGNRFGIYAHFPQCNISMHVMWGRNKQNTVFAVGKSILNKTSETEVGKLMLQYGGGGHEAAGTCQVDNLRADQVKEELIAKITADG